MAAVERPFVEIDQVSMRYGGAEGTLALRNATLSVARGEFVAVVGPSGCGKSTLMKLVSGLWPSSAGSVIVGGQEVDRPLPMVGMAFQNPTLLPWRTILANVMLPLEVVEPHRRRLRAERAAYEAKARQLLAMVGLAGFEGKYPYQLSGGMQQRASLCRALIHDPQLLMLDEPFGALDIFTREDLWAQLQEVCLTLKPTVILVTHDLKEAVYLADRVLVMSSRPGRILAERRVPFPARAGWMTPTPPSSRPWCTSCATTSTPPARGRRPTMPHDAGPQGEGAPAPPRGDAPAPRRGDANARRVEAMAAAARRRRRLQGLLPWLIILGTFLLWEAAVHGFAIDAFILPAPSAIAASMVQWWQPLLENARQTLMTTLVGFGRPSSSAWRWGWRSAPPPCSTTGSTRC
ncbi:ATP-binding cassette domain-containing protein [Teichococcus aestuarii]|uniref:ATP-binding cassette domain-containing protein n=1 Tax=Teichococcus aestuarii TaxID=568898 RepID=UPI00361CA84A